MNSPDQYRRFRLIKALDFVSTSNDRDLIEFLEYLIENENRKSKHLEAKTNLDFATEKWKQLVLKMVDGLPVLDRKHFEVCVFSHLAQELKAGDIAIADSEEYADYRHQLLAWEDCEPVLGEFCVRFYTNWMRHFGPLSGSDAKLQKPIERYLLALFTYGLILVRRKPPDRCAELFRLIYFRLLIAVILTPINLIWH